MNQQSEFERREQAANIVNRSHTVNNDPREQGQGQERGPLQNDEAYQAGYAAAMRQRLEGYGGNEGQKIYPQSQRRRPRRLWIAAIIILLLLALSAIFNFAYNAYSNHPNATSYPTHTFTVGAMPKVVVNAEVGSIRFHTGSNDTVMVTVTEKGGGMFNQSHGTNVESTQDSNSNTITVNEQKPSNFINNTNVDIDVTLPANSNIQATLNLGDISINGVNGTMDVKDNTGKVDISDSTLTGASSIRENIGDITFQGSITNDGDYTFEDNTGAINLTLPTNQIFALDSKTNIGKVTDQFNSSDGPASTDSHIHLHLKDNIGAININKQ